MNNSSVSQPFEPYRSIGSFIEGPASHAYSIDKKFYFACSTGSSYKVYSLPDLKIKLLSPSLPTPISFIAAFNEFVFAAGGSTIYKLHFQHLVAQRALESQISCMAIFGKLLFVGLENRSLCLLESSTLEQVQLIILGFAPRLLVHPNGYLNKLLIASEGSLALYNVNSGQLLYDYRDSQEVHDVLLKNRLTAAEDSPAPDVAALGFGSGVILGLQLKTSARVFEFKQIGAVTSLVFTRDPRQPPRLLSGSSNGEILVWSLAKKSVEARVTTAFVGAVSVLKTLAFRDQELLLAASPEQNAIKILRLDEQAVERFVPLRERQGLVGPLGKVRFYNERFLVGLSAEGHGELIRFSLFNDAASQLLSTRVSKGKASRPGFNTELTRKTEDIEDFCFSELKINLANNHNLFTKHKESPYPLFWDLEALTLRSVFLELQSDYKAAFSARYADRMKRFRTLSALEVSNCGNFLFLGYSDGVLLKLATQSGRLLSDFVDELSSRTDLPVDALHSDFRDHYLLARCAGKIFKLDFFKGALLQEKSVSEAGCYRSDFERRTELLALCLADGSVEIVQGGSLQTVRRFELVLAKVNDLCFFPADRKIVLACEDHTLLVVDLFLGELLSRFRFDKQIVSLCFDEQVRFLATAFKGERSVCLWKVNNLHLKCEQDIEGGFVSELREFPRKPRLAYFSEAIQNAPDNPGNLSSANKDTFKELKAHVKTAVDSWQRQNQGNLAKTSKATFSEVPGNKWKGLLDIEAILAQNELLQKQFKEVQPEELPFFLSFGESPLERINEEVVGSLEPLPKIKAKKQTKDLDTNELIDQLGDPIQKTLSSFSSLIEINEKTEKQFSVLFSELKKFSAAEIDYFMKKNLLADENAALKLCAFFVFCFKEKNDLDFKHALLKHFLTVF